MVEINAEEIAELVFAQIQERGLTPKTLSLYVSPGQINPQAPDDTATGTVRVVVTTSVGSATSTVALV